MGRLFLILRRAVILVGVGLFVVAELGLLTFALVVLVSFVTELWFESPFRAALAAGGLVGVAVLLRRSHRSGRAQDINAALPGPPTITMSRIPITGLPGALYMIQFAVWALVAPAVGILYAVLVGGALLLLPLVFFLNRPGRPSSSTAATAAILGALCGLVAMTYVSLGRVPLAGFVGLGLACSAIAAAFLVWRWRQSHSTVVAHISSEDPG